MSKEKKLVAGFLGIFFLSIFLVYKLITFENESPFKLENENYKVSEYKEGYKLIEDNSFGIRLQYPVEYIVKPLTQDSFVIYKTPPQNQKEPTSYVLISRAQNEMPAESLETKSELKLKVESPILIEELPFPTSSPNINKISKKIQNEKYFYTVEAQFTEAEKSKEEIEFIIESLRAI